ncbi:alpha/beta hydrolase, partial [Xanthobacter autotrophicus]|uniref:alpha/beta hydrolase fold domain-containing protein n=3 Tax=Xanthobacter TaxID=279 RepID=UPI0024AAE6A4
PYAAPLASSRLQGLPPALVVSAQDCPMRDESARYAGALEKARVATELHILPGPTHWPDGISAPPEKPESWAGALRTLFARFFEISRPRRRKPAPAVL